jgi:hypothetical protein
MEREGARLFHATQRRRGAGTSMWNRRGDPGQRVRGEEWGARSAAVCHRWRWAAGGRRGTNRERALWGLVSGPLLCVGPMNSIPCELFKNNQTDMN